MVDHREPKARRRRNPVARGLGLSLLGILGVAVLALAAAVVWRVELAELAARHWLAAAGFPDAEVEVSAIGWRRAVLGRVDLGPGAPRAERIVLAYRASGLWQGRLVSAEVAGLRLTVDAQAEETVPWLAALRQAASAADGVAGAPAGGVPALPVERVRFEQALLTVRRRDTALRVSADGELTPRSDGLALALEGEMRGPGTRIGFSASARALAARSVLRLAASGHADAGRLPWPATWPVRPITGRLRVDGRYSGPIPEIRARRMAGPGMPLPGRLEVELGLEEIGIAGYAEDLQGGLALRWDPDAGTIGLRLREPVSVALGADAEGWRALGLNPAAAGQLAAFRRLVLREGGAGDEPLLVLTPHAQGWQSTARFRLEGERGAGRAALTVSLRGRHGRHALPQRVEAGTIELAASDLAFGSRTLERLRFAGNADWDGATLAAEGELQARAAELAIGDRTLAGIALTAPLALRAGDRPGALTVGLSGTGRLSVAALPRMADARLDGPLDLALVSGEASIGDAAASGRLRMRARPVTGVVAAPDGAGVPFELAPGVLELVFHHAGASALRLIAEDARLRLPDTGLHAAGLSADIAHSSAQGLSGSLALARLEHAAAPAAFAPLQLSGEISGALDTFTVAGALGPAERAARVPFRLTHNAETGAGHLHVGPADLAFRPGALVPADLFPRLAALENVQGELRLDGVLSWGGDGADGRMRLAVADADFDVAGIGVSGLDTVLEFTRLRPPRTAPDQRLTVRALRAGLSLTDLRARFRVVGDSVTAPPAIDLAALEADFAGGSLRVEDTRLDPGGARNAATVQVMDVALERLLAELGLGEQVTGEGRLSGRIPVRLEAGGIVVADGELRAGGPGRMRVRLRETGEALGRQAREMELMIRALEDFRYQVLAAELERAADGELRLALQLEGHNPDVLEGHPFRFNITLSGNLDPVFRALRLGGDIGADFLREHLQLR